MLIEDKKIKDVLLKENYLKAEDLKKAEEFVGAHGGSFLDYLYQEQLVSEKTIGQAMAESFGLKFADLDSVTPDDLESQKIPESFARKHRIVFWREDHDGIIFATDSPKQMSVYDDLKHIFKGKKYSIAYANTSGIEEILAHYRKTLDTRFSQILRSGKPAAPEILKEIFEDALTFHASDIHIEPNEEGVLIRFRVDGVLQEAGKINKDVFGNILNLVKVQSNVKIDDHFSAQDGSIRYETKDNVVDMRVSIVPTVNGENIVLRLLAHYVRGFTLEDIGLSENGRNIIESAYKKPFGMILVVGPTGSGKTTSLYTILKILNRPDVNITSIEDPVEYRIPGANQIQVNEKTNLTFSKGLRSIVRQDPDVIFVGEIRDTETAEISVNAALTGHLLLSTFHANDAASAIPRLYDMGVEPFLLSSTLELILAQRLVRTICPNCRASKETSISALKSSMKNPESYFKHKDITLFHGKGCKNCNNTGYKGRIGIFEFIEVTKEMKELLMTRPPAEDIAEFARKQGSFTMFEDGLDKVLRGVTTLEELLRVANPPE